MFKHPNSGVYLLQNMALNCNNKNGKVKTQNQQLHHLRHLFQEQRVNLPSLLVLCLWRHHLLIMAIFL